MAKKRKKEKQLLYLHPITGMQTNCLVCETEITEVRTSSHETTALLARADQERRLELPRAMERKKEAERLQVLVK